MRNSQRVKDIAADLPGFSTDEDGNMKFTLRHDISFGATPEEVIETEYRNGFPHDKYGTAHYNDMLFEAENDYQLNYVFRFKIRGKKRAFLGCLPVFRFEYDFDKNDKKLYRFLYVPKRGDSDYFFFLKDAIQEKHGLPNPDSYDKKDWSRWPDHRHWRLSDNTEYCIIIDLWISKYDTCFLAYRRQKE